MKLTKKRLGALRAARDRVERGWCQHSFALDANGFGTSEFDKGARSWCLMGALVASDAGPQSVGALSAVVGALPHDLIDWNDKPGRTQAEVLAALDRTIAIATVGRAIRLPEKQAARVRRDNGED